MNIFGYTLAEQLHQSNQSLIYRGHRQKDNRAVVLKVLNKDYPSEEDFVRFYCEYEITRSLQADGIIEALAIESSSKAVAIVLEDFGGESLANYLPKRKLVIVFCMTVYNKERIH